MTTTTKTSIVSGIIALVVALVVGLSFAAHSTSPTPVSNDSSVQAPGAQSGPVQNTPWNFTKGASLGGKYVSITDSVKIAPNANSVSWTNTTGRTVFVWRVDGNFVPTVGSTTVTASSTYAFYAYASSTAATTTYDFTAPAQTNTNGTILLINNFALATTSSATTTSSFDKAFSGKVVQVPDRGRVSFVLQGQNAGCSPTSPTDCVTSTSTSRGFDIDAMINGYYAP